MVKIVGIVKNDAITSVQYGTVEFPETQTVEPYKKSIQQKTKSPAVATQQTKKIKQPARGWQNKMSATKKQILDQQRTKQK